jgi:hypothetical protein
MNKISFYKTEQNGTHLLWLGVVILALLKLILVSGTAVPMTFSPHDDSLYLLRAFHLLMDGDLGAYDARLLIKQPGISLWLAGVRLLGIPYILSINVFFIISGIYFIAALKRYNVNYFILLLAFGLYIFNPVSIDHQWIHVFREPLSTCMLTMMLASMVFIFVYLKEKRLSLIHFLVLAVVFALAVMVREEDRLLYGLLSLFVAVVSWKLYPSFFGFSRASRFGVIALILLPFMLAMSGNVAMKAYIELHYGAALVNDFGGGEFPRLIAAIRSVESRKDNRHVMITQEALSKIRVEVPEFAPVIDLLPAPSQKSFSCIRFKVCSEWTNGWQFFWIKDAAFNVGLTPTLPAGQAYFRKVRLGVERACQEGRLKCRDKGHGMFPPFELRWTNAFLQEMAGVLNMITKPSLSAAGMPPPTYDVEPELGRAYQMVTMSHRYDSELQGNKGEWKSKPKDIYFSLKYWLNYPDVALSKDFGVEADGGVLGAQVHYERYGQHESRVWQIDDLSVQRYNLTSPIESWKNRIFRLYEKFGFILMMLGMVAFLVRLSLWHKIALSPLMWIALIFTLFTGLRILALSYVSVYMGRLDGRLFFSTYVVVILIAPLIIADLFAVLMMRRAEVRKPNFVLERNSND